MRKQHAAVNGQRIAVEFKGKSGKLHQSEITDHRLTRTMQRCRELPEGSCSNTSTTTA